MFRVNMPLVMSHSRIRALSPLIDALLLMAIFCLTPFAWLLRDGLGPDSIQTSGFPAAKAAFMTFYAGPAILLLVGLRFLMRHLTKSAEGGESSSKSSFYWLWMIILLVFLTLLASALLFG